MNWDDLRFLRAVAHAGTLSGAARSLGLSHPTVLRRIQRIERQWVVGILEKTPTGYVPTLHGAALVDLADDIAARMTAIDRQIDGQDPALQGTVRITTTDTFHFGFLAPLLVQLREEFPYIELEVSVSNEMYNLSSRDADIAIRPTSAPPESLVGRNMGKVGFAVYLHKDLLTKGRDATPLSTMDWIGLDDSLSHLPLANWMNAQDFAQCIRLRVNSVHAVLHAIKAGFGPGVIACFMADGLQDFVQVSPRIGELATDLWVLTHPDMKDTPRIRAVLDRIYAFIEERQTVLAGTDDQPEWIMAGLK